MSVRCAANSEVMKVARSTSTSTRSTPRRPRARRRSAIWKNTQTKSENSRWVGEGFVGEEKGLNVTGPMFSESPNEAGPVCRQFWQGKAPGTPPVRTLQCGCCPVGQTTTRFPQTLAEGEGTIGREGKGSGNSKSNQTDFRVPSLRFLFKLRHSSSQMAHQVISF